MVSADLADRYRSIREQTTDLCEPLETEDYVLQSMPDASPAKWHVAHTTWFFETFLLKANVPSYEAFDPDFNYLFNSYYNAVGPRHPRPSRGILSRPPISRVWDYRRYVDDAMSSLLERALPAETKSLIELGINHEQQHQELLLTDIKHAFSLNPLFPRYRPPIERPFASPHRELAWIRVAGGLREIGFDGIDFAFDNELPRHRVFVEDFLVANRLITNREYLEFIEDSGYRRPELWLSEGWDTVQLEEWQAPLYWFGEGSDFQQFTLSGLRPLEPDEPVTHISYYEADAYARWTNARLLSESEWEVLAAMKPIEGNFLEDGLFQPRGAGAGDDVSQLFGDAWEWTSSPYIAYPGFKTAAGAIGEYNGKFMCNQMVLRGGSCVTPTSHIRATYRNFFHPNKRWQFTGIRLGRDAGG